MLRTCRDEWSLAEDAVQVLQVQEPPFLSSPAQHTSLSSRHIRNEQQSKNKNTTPETTQHTCLPPRDHAEGIMAENLQHANARGDKTKYS
jgi:hypothetical protein